MKQHNPKNDNQYQNHISKTTKTLETTAIYKQDNGLSNIFIQNLKYGMFLPKKKKINHPPKRK